MNDEALLAIRRPGTRLLTALFWLNVPVLAVAGWLIGHSDSWLVTGLAALLCAIPTLMVRAGRTDAAARMAIGLTAVCFPALFLFLFDGHRWQMDMHMYFFAALAALTVLCDKRAILVPAGLIAIHHLILNYVAPQWVFTGIGDLPRVVLHAAIVVMQTAVLLWLTHRLASLIIGQAEDARTSEALRIEADAARARSDEALTALEAAQEAAQHQRATEDAVRAAQEAAERRRLVANAIEARLGAIVSDLGRMAVQLSTSKDRLVTSLEQTVSRSDELRSSHARAEADVRVMATDTERLVASIHEVGRNATRARATAHAGAHATGELSPKVEALGATVEAASHILKLISSIAAQSRMLALNATIEAGRGDDSIDNGRSAGFAVVAAEIKTLAAQTAEATGQIAGQLENIRSAAESVSGAINIASASVRSIDDSAAAIADVVQGQIVATTEIASASEQMAEHIALAATEADALSNAIGEVRSAMEQTDSIATAVSDRSQELNETVRSVLAELRAA